MKFIDHLEIPLKKNLFLVLDDLTDNAPDSDRNDLLSELAVMKKLKPHRHVIKLLGCVTESGKF